MRAAATTAVVAGTAGAVRHHQQQKYANQEAQQAPPEQYQAAPAEPAEDPYEALKKLAELHDQGILTDEEFAAQKAKILG
ncbi:MAG TPA: SHOCT domain-containing protein [Acidimicrobiales bacterium]|nr:SHOCT domain-containing protein [Acidimicrobiales bacterium]